MTLAWHALRTPTRPAIVMGADGETVTFRDLEVRSRQLAGVLRQRGVQTGSVVAILMENNRSYLEVTWAAQRSGLYFTAVNRHLTAEEVQYILDDSGAVALVTSEQLADVIGGLDLSRIPVRIAANGEVDGFECYEQLLRDSPPGPIDGECEGREMLYSSGTTGRPKGVRKPLPLTPLGDPSAPTVQIAAGLAMTGDTDDAVYLCPAPLYHGAPLIFSMSWQRLGATVVVMERFDAAQGLELIDRYRVTTGQFVPTMFTRFLRLSTAERERHDLSSLRSVIHSAAPCPIGVKEQMIQWWGPIISEYYSGTEDVGTTFITAQEWMSHRGSVGRPMETCHIVGPDGSELPPGETGEVYFEGGRPFEYHNDPGKTSAATNDKGWRTLGDIGRLDADGYLYLTDRAAHMIISGGVNIYPQEAENVLATHPSVADVAVIGVPDDEMGESALALVQPVDGAGTSEELAAELLAYVRSRLAGYKCPRAMDFVASLPRDPNGKLYKRRLREQYWSDHDSLVV
ncbi:acyl-CoA synthetase [Gordonia hankookensis]|uniref:Acyl-CoA synthetase n=1 Tax=Gordonia hankookensis TaxID=589403 RepID=A0ABR7W9F8_9ACTN|nr:acyl-CoA synthetase [Gordonia hankookensis]MBD1319445.1 acyl-CoA synthetase [Gordonia hankookensis]